MKDTSGIEKSSSYALKEYRLEEDVLKFELGLIGDCDQVYLNGQLIGQNGKNMEFIRDTSFNNASYSYVYRSYRIPINSNYINWDGENVIAMRIFNREIPGRFKLPSPYISMLELKDFVSINKKKFYKAKGVDELEQNLILKNKFKTITLKGNLFVAFTNKSGKAEILDLKIPLKLKPGDSMVRHVELPIVMDKIRVAYKYEDVDLNKSFSDIDSIPFSLSITE